MSGRKSSLLRPDNRREIINDNSATADSNITIAASLSELDLQLLLASELSCVMLCYDFNHTFCCLDDVAASSRLRMQHGARVAGTAVPRNRDRLK